MCGISGFLALSRALDASATEILKNMGNTLGHRGPDYADYWLAGDEGIGLSHRRLAIVDLSPSGRQPMVSLCERFVIVFNGEIYNHIELRRQLSDIGNGYGDRWRGHSDTETLLSGFSIWGIQKTIERCIGMFAFAVWDRKTRMLTLGRDRLGEKPLYYGWQGSGRERVFLFGSELKALKVHPAFKTDIDRGALCLLLRHNCIPAPYSIYHGIAKLEPGCLLSVSLAQPEPKIWKYWDSVAVACAGVELPFTGTADEAADSLEMLLKDAVRQQMMGDVPVGAFLSGGVDSSTIVALMQVQSSRPVKTFTIGVLTL